MIDSLNICSTAFIHTDLNISGGILSSLRLIVLPLNNSAITSVMLWVTVYFFFYSYTFTKPLGGICSSIWWLCMHSLYKPIPPVRSFIYPWGMLSLSNINVVPTENGRSKKRDDLLPTFSPKGTVSEKIQARDV